MSSELEQIRARMRTLIQSTCNTIGCKDCPSKWPKDENGNTCQSDYLMGLEHEAEKRLRVGDLPDKPFRALISHPESDCLFEVFSEAERNSILVKDPCCCDVTGEASWESLFFYRSIEDLL